MTGQLDSKIRPLATNLVAKYGKAITLIRVTEGSYNPATGTTTNTEASETLNAVIEEYKGYNFANNLAQQGDKKVTCAAYNFTKPSLLDKLTIDGVTFSIVQIQTVYSGELAAMYVMQGRIT